MATFNSKLRRRGDSISSGPSEFLIHKNASKINHLEVLRIKLRGMSLKKSKKAFIDFNTDDR